MVQRSGANVSNVEVNNTYIYYLMNNSSVAGGNGNHKNELTDADSIDSGTCSDNSQKTSPIPPPIPKKQGGVGMSTKIVLTGSEPIYSDSEESESSLSSLGSSTTTTNFSLTYFPDSLLKDIRDHSLNTLNRKDHERAAKITIKVKDLTISDTELDTTHNGRQLLHQSDLRRASAFYETDKYYNFHINERDAGPVEVPVKVKAPDFDESFAGFREAGYQSSGSSTIRSAKGTVRGVKNRVGVRGGGV